MKNYSVGMKIRFVRNIDGAPASPEEGTIIAIEEYSNKVVSVYRVMINGVIADVFPDEIL